MRRASSFHPGQKYMELKMTSLIDVVFLLLIFFVWTASFRITEYVLPSQVSQSTPAGVSNSAEPPPPEADFPEIVVRIAWAAGAPVWMVNDEAAGSLGEVREKLARVFAIYQDAPVILHPDPAVPLGHVIDLYDLTRGVGFGKVQFATSQEVPL